MRRCMGLGVLCLLLAGLGCGGDEADTSRTARVFDQLSDRETAYHASVNSLPTTAAIRAETADYTSDMHALLDSMREACTEMMHGSSTMGGHTMDDMNPIMDQMRSRIDDYASRMQDMDDMEAMRDACEQHHADMAGMLHDMDATLADAMPCCGR